MNSAKRLDIILQKETSDQLTELSLHGDKTKTALLSELVAQAYNEKKSVMQPPQNIEQKLNWWERPGN